MVEISQKWIERNNKAKERLAICETCEFLQQNVYMCKKCGCFMKVKTMFPNSKCPIDKWDKYIENEN